jgi:hypothetical protein
VDQPRWPASSEWINKTWCTYTMACYSAVKKNEITSFVGKWMEIKIMLSEISQTQKNQILHLFADSTPKMMMITKLEYKGGTVWRREGGRNGWINRYSFYFLYKNES